MRIEIDKDQLMEAIGIADYIIPSRSVNAILSNCLFNVIKDEIEIISTDNEIGIKTRVEASADGEVSFTVDGKRFYGILKEIPKGPVYINVSSSSALDITSKAVKGHYRLLGTPADDYPDLPAFNNKADIEIRQNEFKTLIRKVMYAAAADNLKPVYNGIYVVLESSKRMTFVATDSRRLAIITKEMDEPAEIEEGIIIPLKTVHELFRLLTAEGTCGFSINKHQCFFKINDTEVMSRVIDGQFPNYKQVIPKDYQIVATVQTDRFLNSLRRAMIFTREPSNRVVLHFSKEKLVIEAKTPDLGEAEEEIQIESSSKESISIGINAQFLLEALREMESNTVAVGITGQMSPMTITPDNNREYISVIMPIKIKASEED